MKRWTLVLIVLSILLFMVLPACGGSEGTKTVAPTSTPTTTATPSSFVRSTATPTPSGPVKIGAINAWSGPMAMAGILADQIIAVVERLKNKGGILGGREVKFIRGDDRGAVAEAAAQAKKLVLEDKVTILTFGGVSAAQFTAVADVAEELKVPYVALAAIYGVAAKKYSAYLYGSETVHKSNCQLHNRCVEAKDSRFPGI